MSLGKLASYIKDYVSFMNCDEQFSLVDYSKGLNILNGHDDWSAVLVGMDDPVTLGEDSTEDLYRNGFSI
jgi:hypothetical protein